MRILIAALLVFGLGLCFIGVTMGMAGSDDRINQVPQTPIEQPRNLAEAQEKIGRPLEAEAPEYASDQLIIKLKEGRTLDDIRELNERYDVIQTEKIFKEMQSPLEVLRDLKERLAKLTEHEGWYWQLDKGSEEYRDYLAKIEKEKQQLRNQIIAKEKFVEQLAGRQKRAPQGTIPPNLTNIYLLKTDSNANIALMTADYKSNMAVEYAEPNYIVKAQSFPQVLPNDTYVDPDQDGNWAVGIWGQVYEDMWGLKKIKADRSWIISQGENVIVAVVDTGIDYNHEDISDNVWTNNLEIAGNGIDDDSNGYIDDTKGWDFVDKEYFNPKSDNDPMDGNGHGSHVAGTIAAVGNNSRGIIGVAPKANIMAVKGLDDYGQGYSSHLANSLTYAVDNGADVINNSWGGESRSQLIEDSIKYGYANGCLLVVAAGNSNADVELFYPANMSEVITVSATDPYDVKTYFSNYGSKIDVSAPGGGSYNDVSFNNILSTLPDNSFIARVFPDSKVSNGYYRLKGTSMAAPHVSGVAALAISRHPEFINEQVKQVLRVSADDVSAPGWDLNSGYGRINSYNVLQINSPKVAVITSPARNKIISGLTEIIGTASGTSYKVEYGEGLRSDLWFEINRGVSVATGSLASWDTSLLQDGDYTLKLTVNDIFVDRSFVSVDNIAISYPKSGEVLRAGETLVIKGTVKGTDFQSYAIDYQEDGSDLWLNEGIVLSDGGTLPVEDGVLATWDTSRITATSHYTLRLTVNSVGFSRQESIKFYLDPTLHKGWPIKLGGTISVAPSIGDVDRTYSGLEIAASSYDGGVYLFHQDGSLASGWPIRQNNSWGETSPALANLDGDQDLEVIFTMNGNNVRTNPPTIYAANHDGSQLSGWPISLYGASEASSPSVADIDNDGDKEIILGASVPIYDSNKIYVFNQDGSLPSGWPVTLPKEEVVIHSVPVVGDLNKDGFLEIVIATERGKLYAFDRNGGIVSGWPVDTGCGFYSAPVLGDIDNDGDIEVVIGSYAGSPNKIFAFNYNGTPVSGWPQEISGFIGMDMSLALGDIDGDRSLEIVAGVANKVMAWHHDGSQINEWTQNLPYEARAPILGDIDGDGMQDLIIGCGADIKFSDGTYSKGEVFVFNRDGNIISSWPKEVGRYVSTSAALGDIDNDGSTELIIGTGDDSYGVGGSIFIWDLAGSGDRMEWPMFLSNPQHTGCYIPADTISPTGSIIINNNAAYTNSTLSVLSLSAQDNEGGSGIGLMQFSNDNINWSPPEKYIPIKNWTLSGGNGKKTVYARFGDAAGNWSKVYSDAITLDMTKPVITHQPITSAKKNRSITFIATIEDSGSGLKKAEVVITIPESRRLAMAAIGSNRYKAVLSSSKVRKDITYSIQAQDKANNISSTPSYTIRVR